MDNLCHTLLGVALGRAGLARRTRLGMSTLVIASNLPDVDVAVFATNTLAVSFRRGWTHGVLAQATLPVVLAGVMTWWARRDHEAPSARFGALLLLSYVGVLTHVFLDFLNTYGVRLLMPFSERWFYGDALFVVDPWMYLMLGLGVWYSMRRERQGMAQLERPARVAVATAVVYVLTMLGSNVIARMVVAEGLDRAGRPADTRVMVSPVVLNPFRREVVIDMGDRYQKGAVWFVPLPHFRPSGFGIDTHLEDPTVVAAIAAPRARAFLMWSRFPFAVVDRAVSPPRVWLNDYRYADTGPGGWSATDVAADAADKHR